MSVKIVLRRDKVNEQGVGPLFLRITNNRKSSFMSLNRQIKESEWDGENELVKSWVSNAEAINAALLEKKQEAQSALEGLRDKNRHSHPNKIKNLLKYKDGVPFFDYADDFLHRLEVGGNLLTFKNYRSSVKKFKDFADDSITFDEINDQKVRQYRQYLSETLGNKQNTVYNNLKVLRKIFNEAIRGGVVSYEHNPFLKVKFSREEKGKDFLNEQELWRIESTSFGRNSAVEHIKKMFLFSCYSGLKISNIQGLTWADYDNNSIVVRTSRDEHKVKLINKALQILNSYRLNQDDSDEKKIFPNYSTTYINKNLKLIATGTRIEKNLKFSTGRNTFIVLALKKGIRLDQIARLLGIKNLKTIQEFARYMNDDLDMVVGKLNREFL